jgi:hypothetical protein
LMKMCLNQGFGAYGEWTWINVINFKASLRGALDNGNTNADYAELVVLSPS